MRILLIGPGVNRKYGDRFYYSTARRLMNGFIRNGHFVMHVSDRDLSDYFLGLRALGKHYACRRIETMAAHVQPHLIVLLLADLISPAAIATLRKAAPGVKVVAVEIDALALSRPAKRFDERLDHCDACFATTGGALLKQQAGSRTACFIPNLVDPSIDDALAYENTAITSDVFFAGQKNQNDLQWERALALQSSAPELTYCYKGAAKAGGLWGHTYITTMGESKIGLNLNAVEGSLYASDRMGQYLGNGLLLATDRRSGFDRYFNDDEMIFFSTIDELKEKVIAETGPGDTWRAKARKAREKALTIMSGEIVCRQIVSQTFEGKPCPGWVFS